MSQLNSMLLETEVDYEDLDLLGVFEWIGNEAAKSIWIELGVITSMLFEYGILEGETIQDKFQKPILLWYFQQRMIELEGEIRKIKSSDEQLACGNDCEHPDPSHTHSIRTPPCAGD